jgi:hypothetical protein
MEETGRLPIMVFWMKQALKFWNKINGRSNGDLVKMALHADVARFLDNNSKSCWASLFVKCLRDVGAVQTFDEVRNASTGSLINFDVPIIVQKMVEQWSQYEWADMAIAAESGPVRACPGNVRDGFKLHTYHRWFRADAFEKKHSFMYHLQRHDHIQVVAQFRMGAHWLNVEMMRHGGVPRDRRLCTCCDQKAREDEMHIMECPLYATLRTQHADVFGDIAMDGFDDECVRRVMNGKTAEYWWSLANFLLKSREMREMRLI